MKNVRRLSIHQLYGNHVKSWLQVRHVPLAEIKIIQLAQLFNFSRSPSVMDVNPLISLRVLTSQNTRNSSKSAIMSFSTSAGTVISLNYMIYSLL